MRMKTCLLVLVLVAVRISSFAEELPKSSFGKYGGEMPAYEVYVDGNPLAISPHDVYISIFADEVIYSSAHLVLSGTYSVYKQSKNEYVVKAQLSNGKSVNYELEFTWNKKENKIYLTARNGQAAAVLERMSA